MQTIEQIRSDVEAAKVAAMANFKASTGFDDPKGFFLTRLAPAIPGSASPADAMRKALTR